MGDITKITMPERLIELREHVLSRTTKRMPKWKFRLADDMVLMLQPKVAEDFYVWDGPYGNSDRKRHDLSLRFAGAIVSCANASAAVLTSQKDLDAFLRHDIRIGIDTAGNWYMNRRAGAASSGPRMTAWAGTIAERHTMCSMPSWSVPSWMPSVTAASTWSTAR